ncbi:MAG: methionine--tRNA ligase [Candidatus Omnitrophica bacterium]|nr:methionine--tRNA ligase [Candidatus Omnitrophota bacterium]
MSRYYLTTPLYYVNAAPHLGHAYTTVIADCLARYHRLKGDGVFFLTGTDEHGQKIEQAAAAAGKAPKEFADSIVPGFKKLWETLHISYDHFIRTTDSYHTDGVRAALEKLFKEGKIYPKTYDGWYCVPDETFCPKPDIENGKPVCPDCHRPIEQIKEKNYFFKLGEYQNWLAGHIEKNDSFIVPKTRRNEVLSFLKDQKLQDLCISRPKARLEWGIEMPSPPFEPGYVTYVWFDALLNYITALGYPDMKNPKWIWPADVHLIGKDILRPHAIYWPVMLKALGLEPPKTVAVHGWWLVEGEKMSKSRGNIVDPHTIVAEYGVDAYRYFLLREVPFGHDGTFSEKAMDKRYNADLANDLGNLLHRTLTMIEKYFGGVVPCYTQSFVGMPADLEKGWDSFDFQKAISGLWAWIDQGNTLIDERKPWVLAKAAAKTEELKAVLGGLADMLRTLAILLWPIMPSTSENIWKQLGCPGKISREKLWAAGASSGQKVQKGRPLFPRRE